MVAFLKKEEISTTMEKRIVIGLITSKRFLQDIYPSVDLNFFENRFTKEIAKWCIEYWETHEEPPKSEIKNIYLAKREKMRDEDAELIENILETLSLESDNIDTGNAEYLTDQAFDYFRRRELEITSNNIKYHLSRGDLDNAEKEVVNYRKVAKTLATWSNPFTQESVDQVFDVDENVFFKFPGKLGEFLGPFERDWLVGISGPFKKGKSFFAQEFKINALPQGLRVVEFNLEMKLTQLNKRLYKRIFPSAEGIAGESAIFLYPVFDCLKNQNGKCTDPRRLSPVSLLEGNDKPEYDPDSEYRVCTICRGEYNSLYETETWWEEIERPSFDISTISQAIDATQRTFGDLIRHKCYPRFSASVSDLMRDLDLMERVEGFIPDIIIVDYADILKADNDRLGGIDKEDDIWKMLARMASERHALTIVPTQLTKEALDAVLIKQQHTARWVGKLGHVDSMLSINQTEQEKREGRLRIGTMVHRHNAFEESKTVTLLEKRMLGQVHLDSEHWIRGRRDRE